MFTSRIIVKTSFIRCLFLLALVACISSCKQKNAGYTENLSKFLDTIHYVYDSSPSRGIRLLDSGFAKHKNANIESSFEYFFIHNFYNTRVTHDYKKAMLYADSMISLIEKTHNEQKYAKLYGTAIFTKGDVFFATGRFPEAYQYFYKGKLIGKTNFDNCTMGDYSYHMGMIMYKQGHYKLAAHHFIQSFAENTDCADSFVTYYRNQELLDNAAISYNKAGLTDSAAIYFNKALNYINKDAGKYLSKAGIIEVARGVVYGNQAQLYAARKDDARAEALLKMSIAINIKKGNDNRDAQLSELKLAHLYADGNKSKLLMALLKNIRTQLDTLNNLDAEVDWYHLMAHYYQQNNNESKALAYFNNYDALKDSVTKANQKLKESDVNQQFQVMENESTISNLKNDNYIQKTFLNIAVVYAVTALIIILLVAWNWRRSNKNVKLLSTLNQTVTLQKTQLENSLTELENNNKEKDRILRAVSHDLRNPIGGIASLTALMLMEPDLDAEQLELLQLIQTTTNNSLELINEILEATGALSSKKLTRQCVDINVLLSHSVELLRFKAAEKNQKIMLSVLEAPEELYISREKIWRVLSNLISNAIKFSPAGAVISVSTTIEKDCVRIAVNDHGIGIPDNIKDEVFQMFTEAKRPGTAGEKSFGLGLSICKQIIESHNGRIWFESVPEKGTTFYVSLKKAGV